MVIEGHAIAGGARCLQRCEQAIIHAFRRTFCQVTARAVGSVLRPVEAFFVTCPAEMTQCLSRSGLLCTLLRPCLAAAPALALVFPADKEQDVALVSYLSVVARLVVLGASAVLTEAIGSILTSLATGAAGGGLGQQGQEGQGGQQAMEALMRSVPPEVRSTTSAVDQQAIVMWMFRTLLRLLIDHFDAVGSSPAGDCDCDCDCDCD